MATSNSTSASKQDPLDALQSLINDVVPGTSQSKLPETIRLFHNALDELEDEIIEAKSVLLRDLNELQNKKKKLLAQTTPQPVEAQSKRPISVDVASSPEPMFKDEPMAETVDLKPMAPFPNMSIDLPEPDHMDISIKEQQPNGQQPPPHAGMNGANGKASPGFRDHKPTLDMVPETSSSNQPPTKLENSRMNFTNMEFTLAPPNNQASGGHTTSSKEPFFDLTTFAPADGGDDALNINHLLPSDQSLANNPSNSGPTTATQSNSIPNAHVKMEETKTEPVDPSTLNADFFGAESGAADGMDFDFSLGGTGDDTFDDLMNNRDSTFELMDAGGDFDTAFFGLDKSDETSS
ncbi:hypothetical protein ACHAQJ_003313 [Trichoderma viride]